MVVPIDLRLGGAAPALVARLRLVLHRLGVPAGDDQVGRLQHRGHAQREQPLEIDAAERVVGADRRFLLQDHRALVEPVGRPEDGEPGPRLAADDRPVDRAGAAVRGEQRRVVLDGPEPRDVDEILWRELQHVGHDPDVDLQRAQRGARLVALERGELVHRDAPLLRCDLQRVGPRAFLLGRAEHPGDVVAAGEECLQHGLAEILLADDREFHGVLSLSLFTGPIRRRVVARVERSETRVGAAMATVAPGFAALNPGYASRAAPYSVRSPSPRAARRPAPRRSRARPAPRRCARRAAASASPRSGCRRA